MKNYLKKIVLTIIIWQARIIIKKNNPIIIGVTGNLGKTSTKDFIYSALKNNLKGEDQHTLVISSKKSMNSEFGVPLTILEEDSGWNNPTLWLKIIINGFAKIFEKADFKYLVLEIAADFPGDIKSICTYIKPDIAVLTGFAEVPVHIEFFGGDRERLIREKKYLIEALKPGGTFIYNTDDKDCVKIAEELNRDVLNGKRDAKLKSYSIKNSSADIYASNIDIILHKIENGLQKLGGINVNLKLKSGEEKKVEMKEVVGDAIVYSLLPSLLITQELEIDLGKAITDIQNTKRTNGRMKILDGFFNSIIIDDTYNSSPKAVENGINTIKKIHIEKKKIFVLGDMLELGEFTKAEHERIGSLVVNNCDILITSGIRAKIIAESAIKSGMNGENVYVTSDSLEAGKELLRVLESLKEEDFKKGKTEKEIGGNLIFVKGSQGGRMERVVKMILADHQDSNIDLVRQDKAWKYK
jgi:UDP-N-acetylmuramoyl-tripeptide--D-alanyl-D-alanine ligase